MTTDEGKLGTCLTSGGKTPHKLLERGAVDLPGISAAPPAKELIATLRKQATEIAAQGINGWGNTMICAADELERLTTKEENAVSQVCVHDHLNEEGYCRKCGEDTRRKK